MRKNKGFTLIELLAVIVILAIIAVITVPKVAEMLKTSRQGGAEDSAYGTLKAAELGWSRQVGSHPNIGDGTCVVTGNTLKCSVSEAGQTSKYEFTESLSGTAPTEGTVTLDTNGGASIKNGSDLLINGYYCTGDTAKVTCNDTKSAASGS